MLATPSTTIPTKTPVPNPTTIPVRETKAAVVNTLVPTPTDETPDYKQVWVQIQRDQSSKNINVQLTSARNMGIVSKMEILVTTPNGKMYSEQAIINSGQATITIKDLEDLDRVEVYITFVDGTKYKVKDEVVPIRKYN